MKSEAKIRTYAFQDSRIPRLSYDLIKHISGFV